MEEKEKKNKKLCRIEIKVNGEPVKVCWCQEGENLLEVLRAENIKIDAPCGGLGLCLKCKVMVSGEVSSPDSLERDALGEGSLSEGYRLACRVMVLGDLQVILSSAEIEGDKKITSIDFPKLEKIKFSPEVKRVYVFLSWEQIKGNRSLEEALREKIALETGRQINPISEKIMVKVAAAFEGGRGFEGTVTVRCKDVVSVEVQKEKGPIIGAVYDIGTTTLACYLLDLETGHQLGAAVKRNPQLAFGADVISRIAQATGCHEKFKEMVKVLRSGVASLLQRLAEDVGVSLKDCEEVLMVGNPCMHHFFKGILPITLGRVPFCPVTREGSCDLAVDLDLPVSPSARLLFLPLIGGFVGADMVGLLYFVESVMPKKTRIVVDLGTNGEIALIHEGKILACSTAAGPAFEGGNISCGMVASSGAISAVAWEDGDLVPSVIGGGVPLGISGSGLVDAVAILVEKGVILPSGRIQSPGKINYPSLASRVMEKGRVRSVVIAKGQLHDVVISQKDIRQVQLSKGAVKAAMKILLDRAKITWEDVDEFILAGALGNYINPLSAIKIGLIPSIMEDKIISVGNGAGEGAKLILLGGQKEWAKACAIAEKAEHVPLEDDLTFQKLFMDSLSFVRE